MTICFVHGLGQGPNSWNELVKRLKGIGNCVCPQLFSAETGDKTDFSQLYQKFEEDCAGLEGPIDLCGLSLGAVLALQYTLRNPNKVRSLALIAPQYKMPRLTLKIQTLILHLLPQHSFRGSPLGKKGMIRLLRSMADLDLSAEVSQILCPCAIICGERDVVNLKVSERLSGMIPNAEFHRVAQGGHELNLEAPEALAGILKAFYQNLIRTLEFHKDASLKKTAL